MILLRNLEKTRQYRDRPIVGEQRLVTSFKQRYYTSCFHLTWYNAIGD